MPPLHGFTEHAARRVVAATRGWEAELRNRPPGPERPGVPFRGFWARLQKIFDADRGLIADWYDPTTESYSWLRLMPRPDGTWLDHPLVNVPARELCGFHRGFALNLAAAFEVNRLKAEENQVVWLRPGSQDEIDDVERATRCYLFETGGAGAGWWSMLTERSGVAYSHFTVAPSSLPAGSPVAVAGPSGQFNAYDVNGGSHNSQGPAVPLVVWMRGPYGEGSDVYYLFDYAGTHELDEERFPFIP